MARRRSRAVIVLVALGVTAVAACIAGAVVFLASPNPAPTGPTEFGAEVACESFIKDRLPAQPAPAFGDEKVLGSSPSFIIQGIVTTGSSQRTWTCIVSPDGDRWKLVSLDGLG